LQNTNGQNASVPPAALYTQFVCPAALRIGVSNFQLSMHARIPSQTHGKTHGRKPTQKRSHRYTEKNGNYMSIWI